MITTEPREQRKVSPRTCEGKLTFPNLQFSALWHSMPPLHSGVINVMLRALSSRRRLNEFNLALYHPARKRDCSCVGGREGGKRSGGTLQKLPRAITLSRLQKCPLLALCYLSLRKTENSRYKLWVSASKEIFVCSICLLPLGISVIKSHSITLCVPIESR